MARNYYSQNNMLQMQRSAEARVREMQSLARQALEDANQAVHSGETGGWSTNSGRSRSMNNAPSQPGQARQAYDQAHPRQPVLAQAGGAVSADPPQAPPGRAPPPATPPLPPLPPSSAAAKTTLVEDVIGRLGLDGDTLLIAGLILILINQKADTTLILALAYLLF